MLRWYQAGAFGDIEMRSGFRAPTLSDSAVLLLADVDTVRRRLADDPMTPLAIDGRDIRVSLAMPSSCPDSTQAIEGYDGSLTFMEFDTGGRIAGSARFDLWDRRVRQAGTGGAMAKDARMDFDFKVREGRPYEDFSD
jgi:hypothetical protein